MVVKRSKAAESRMVSPERAIRLYRLVRSLQKGAQTRESLKKRLRLDVRGFYRDLEMLRKAGISITLTNRRYTLHTKLEAAIDLLPFPDPGLTLGEARRLAKGRTTVHQKLKKQLALITR
jgi:hypothetical protein